MQNRIQKNPFFQDKGYINYTYKSGSLKSLLYVWILVKMYNLPQRIPCFQYFLQYVNVYQCLNMATICNMLSGKIIDIY
jgi:hypothetical protein